MTEKNDMKHWDVDQEKEHVHSLLQRIKQEAKECAVELDLPEQAGYDVLAVIHGQALMGEREVFQIEASLPSSADETSPVSISFILKDEDQGSLTDQDEVESLSIPLEATPTFSYASSGSSSGMTNEMLVIGAKAGDRDAFSTLFLSNREEIYRCLMNVVRNDEIAKDVWQETYLKAWRRIQSLKDPLRFKPWVLTIAKHLALDWLRKDRRERTDPLEGGGNTPVPIEADPEIVIEADGIQFVLAEMEPILREVLLLSAAGYSRTEIAHQLGYEESMVTIYQSNAREQFRQLYYVMKNIDDGSDKEKNSAEAHKASQ